MTYIMTKIPVTFDSNLFLVCVQKYAQTSSSNKVVFGYTKLANLCKLSGRPRAVINPFGLSRLQFKRILLSGMLGGMKRASW